MAQERSDKDRWSNAARRGKKSFQAMLKPDEVVLVDAAKRKTGRQTDRELLLHLCREALDR